MISEKEKFFDPRKPFQSARPETHEEWQARMGGEVLAVVRSGLYLDFRFLDQALAALTPTADERCGVLATDGTILCYQPSALLRLYQKNPKYLNRLYLHTVFHCIFRHLWLRGKRDKRLWDLACDIAVENVIDGLGRKSVQRPLTWVRQHAYEEIIAQEKVAAAAPIYRWLVRQTPGVLRQLEKEFYTDDHRLWPKDAPEQPQQMPAPLSQKTWQKIGERMQTELELRDKEAGEGADAMREQIKAANRSRRSYGDFLRRFCVTREEVHLDPDEFDLNFYTYGLSVYGNLPLIEPLETRESKKIEELALVIDTSYSTSGELVRAFLAETYTLLKGRENFFHRMNLHLIRRRPHPCHEPFRAAGRRRHRFPARLRVRQPALRREEVLEPPGSALFYRRYGDLPGPTPGLRHGISISGRPLRRRQCAALGDESGAGRRRIYR